MSGKKNALSIGDIQTSADDDGYACGCGQFCKVTCCFKPSPAPSSHPYSTQPYQRLPTQDPHVQQPLHHQLYQRKSTIHRPVTGHDRDEMIKRYSIAKAKFMGEHGKHFILHHDSRECVYVGNYSTSVHVCV